MKTQPEPKLVHPRSVERGDAFHRTILGVRFFAGSSEEAARRGLEGGLSARRQSNVTTEGTGVPAQTILNIPPCATDCTA